MIYRFLLISDEVDDFAREIQIDSEASFLELQDAILDSVGYTKDQITSFFICDEEWEKEKEITLIEMETSYEDDSWTMEDTTISDLVEEEKQHLLFVFDYMMERVFFMELHEIIHGKSLGKAVCTNAKGEAPAQMLAIDDMATIGATAAAGAATAVAVDDLYNDDLYEGISEFDDDGFEDLDIRGGDPFGDNIY